MLYLYRWDDWERYKHNNSNNARAVAVSAATTKKVSQHPSGVFTAIYVINFAINVYHFAIRSTKKNICLNKVSVVFILQIRQRQQPASMEETVKTIRKSYRSDFTRIADMMFEVLSIEMCCCLSFFVFICLCFSAVLPSLFIRIVLLFGRVPAVNRRTPLAEISTFPSAILIFVNLLCCERRKALCRITIFRSWFYYTLCVTLCLSHSMNSIFRFLAPFSFSSWRALFLFLRFRLLLQTK